MRSLFLLLVFPLAVPVCRAQPPQHETVVVTGTYEPVTLDEIDRTVTVLLARGRVRPFLQMTNITGSSYEEIQGVRMPGTTVLGGVEIMAHGH